MAFDLTRTRYFLTKEVPVAPGYSVSAEGGVLKQIRVNGVENAALTEGTGAAEAIIGFAENNNLVLGVDIVTETVVVPASGIVTLKNANLVADSVWAYNATDAVSLTEISSGSPTTAQFLPNLIQGILTLNTGLAGKTLQVRYKYNLSAQEQLMKFGGRPVNMRSNSDLGTITVIRGFGEIYTDQYDTTVDFSSATALYATAGGLVTTVNTNNTLIPGARVVSVPTASDKWLGVTFNLA